MTDHIIWFVGFFSFQHQLTHLLWTETLLPPAISGGGGRGHIISLTKVIFLKEKIPGKFDFVIEWRLPGLVRQMIVCRG